MLAIPFAGRLELLGLRLLLAGSPTSATESSLTWSCLWAGCSLPAAPHLASQPRSCFQLPRVSCPPVGTFTQLLECAHGRTSSDGCVARVTFPAPTLKAKIDDEGKAITNIRNIAGSVFTRLFVPTVSYKLTERFREAVTALLPKAEANKLIRLCQSASAPRASFETTERDAA